MHDDPPNRLPRFIHESRYCIWCDEPALAEDGTTLVTSEGIVHQECADDFIRQTGGLRHIEEQISNASDELNALQSMASEKAALAALNRELIQQEAIRQLRLHRVPLHYEVLYAIIRYAAPKLQVSRGRLLRILRAVPDVEEIEPGVFTLSS